jgi:hypothetical protein
MNFQDLHELLRLELVRRIESGDLTGTRLAQQTGFRQAHISNFLNRKRALSLEGLDRVLAAQGLTVDGIQPIAIAAGAVAPGASGTEAPGRFEDAEPMEMVPVVSASTAAEEGEIVAASVVETLPVASLRLRDNRARPGRRSAGWQRFVAVRADVQQAAAMEPLLAQGSIAVIDRHYNSLAPYHAHQPTLYAARHGGGLVLRYVEFDEGRLILRPLAMSCPVLLIAVGANELPSDYIAGRVCLLVHEL